MSAMLMIQTIEEETCSCGSGLDESQTVCTDCQDAAIRKEFQREQQADYAARRSQYSHLIHEAVMKANEIVIDPNGDWRVKK